MNKLVKTILGNKPFSLAIFSALSLVLLVLTVATPQLERYFLIRAGIDQSATLRLAVEGLRLTLERYAQIPNLIAARPEIRAFVDFPSNGFLRENARKLLSETAVALRASGAYLEDANGGPLIAVPSVSEDGINATAYRPYFSQAVGGGLGQYYALGTPSGERGFFYAAPVRSGARINAVVTVKFAVDQFEATWREGRAEIIVRDANDIVFMSSRPEWNFRAMAPLSDERMRLIDAARQYPIDQLVLLPNKQEQLENDISLVEIDDDDLKQTFVSSTSLIARAGWRVTILTPTRDAFTLARTITISLVMFILLAVVLALLYWQRRARLAEHLSNQRAAQEMLERRVDERTLELNKANKLLVAEVEERKGAELQLRQTQTELIQAGKLAGLGQMSAALSHELNQPLAAVKAYAENAITLLQRAKSDDAKDNIRHISVLTDRMSSIAKHLRNFARRPQEKTKAVSLVSVIDDALAIMNSRILESDVKIVFTRAETSIFVVGGQVRLQQVFVNLISNALDSMQGLETMQLDIFTEVNDKNTFVFVRDYGVGFSEDAVKSLFDPFFTTKDPGKGLGLGLSISYNIIRDFGGSLSAKNHQDGGALFQVTLINADAETLTEVAE